MKVSVIIPAYNSSNTILSTLNSLKLQTYKEFEIIVVDDGSKDNTSYIVTRFSIENPLIQIKLLKKKNEGVSIARNLGMKVAHGDFIALLDSDDEWLPNKLMRQIEILESNAKIDFLGTCRNGEILKWFLFKKITPLIQISFKNSLFKNYFATPTVIFKRGILQDVGFFNETQSYCEDSQYFSRICYSKECFLLNESLVITGGGKFHYGQSGLSSNIYEMEKGELSNLYFFFKLKYINFFEYFSLVIFSLLKFIKRILNVFFLRNAKKLNFKF